MANAARYPANVVSNDADVAISVLHGFLHGCLSVRGDANVKILTQTPNAITARIILVVMSVMVSPDVTVPFFKLFATTPGVEEFLTEFARVPERLALLH